MLPAAIWHDHYPRQTPKIARESVPGIDMQSLKKAAFVGEPSCIEEVYAQGRRERVAKLASVYPEVVTLQNFDHHADSLRDLEVIFTTWGMPRLTDNHLDRLPALQAVFYAAGSVRHFARSLLSRNITVVSAWQANAIPVAEFALGQILLANKGYFRNAQEYKRTGKMTGTFEGRGNFGETIAILGAGTIGGRVIELLRPFNLRIVVFDPFLSPAKAAEWNVEKVSLEAAFERAYVISNHLANVPETVRMLNGRLFSRMRPNATFINTGRGATVNEAEMIAVLQERCDLMALLDVTFPEPPAPGSAFYTLPNIQISSHIAGSIGDEIVRMADYCIEEFKSFVNNEPLDYAVTLPMVEMMS